MKKSNSLIAVAKTSFCDKNSLTCFELEIWSSQYVKWIQYVKLLIELAIGG
jgi:hypothetical protein